MDRAESGHQGDDKRSLSFTVLLALLLSFILPVEPEIFGFRIDPYRFMLLFLYLPVLILYTSGRAGRFILPDLLIFLFCFWMVISFLLNHGPSVLPYALMRSLEYSGGYLLGRLLVRNKTDFRLYIFLLIYFLIFMFPIAFIELLYAHNILLDLIPAQFQKVSQEYEIRYGLFRVKAGFPHAIHFGLVCSVALANSFFVGIERSVIRFSVAALVIVLVFMSLSSAPWLSAALQIFLILWGRFTQSRWWLLIFIFSTIFVVFEIFSNRGLVIFFFENFTIRPMSGWWRVHIWNYGTESVLNHPIFGIGLNDWDRPSWLASTVDNFWLLIAMRHGLPAIMFLGGALLIHIVLVIREKRLGSSCRVSRFGYVIAFVGTIVSLATVHIWDSVVVFIMIYVGAGAFFYTGGATLQASEEMQEPRRGPSYARQRAGQVRHRTSG